VCFSLVHMDVRTVPHCLARRPSTAALEVQHVRVCDELPILRRRERRSSFLIFPKTVMLWRQEIVWRREVSAAADLWVNVWSTRNVGEWALRFGQEAGGGLHPDQAKLRNLEFLI
jgi:hypothetical protein